MKKDLNIFYLYKDQQNIPICQYLSLDHFITHLITKQYYIRRKNLFVDINEKTLPLKLRFLPTQAFPKNENGSMAIDKRLNEAHIEKFNKYEELSNCFVSCWTMNTEHSDFMWETYAYKYGVCIKSSIYNYIASFNNKDFLKYEVYCAPIDYRNATFCDSPDDLLFVKKKLFSLESEMRFLFLPNDKETTKKENIWLPYKCNIMIDEAVLSPYFSKSTQTFLKSTLESHFDISVRTTK